MPEAWEHTRRYDSSFASVILAFSLRYPSPVTPHIISVDVVSRQVSLHSGCLYTDRIILKRGATSALPKWFPTALLGRSEAWVFERSSVDVEGNEAVVLTRNLDHRRVMDLHEDLFIHSNPVAEPNTTHIDTRGYVTSSIGFSAFQSKVEQFGINRFKLAVERSRNQVRTLIGLLRNPGHHKTLLEGHPPPLSAMLAPALGESLTHWEEVGSGFSGHGFDDREKERYLPDPTAPPPPRLGRGTYVEWLRTRRAELAQTASDRLSNMRTRLFGWRLQMTQIEREEVVNVPKDTKSRLTEQSESQTAQATGETEGSDHQASSEPAQPETRKSKSWVWQWIRNR